MRRGNGSHRENGDEVGNTPAHGHKGSDGEDNHAGNEDDGEHHGEFEL